MWGYTSPWEGVPAKGGVHAWGVYLPMGACTYKGSVHARGCTSPWEGVSTKGVYMLGGVPSHGRVYLERECTCWGVYLPMGGCIYKGSVHAGGCTFPWEGVPRKGVYMLGGVPPHGRVYLQRECTCWGVYLPMGGCTCQGGCTYWGCTCPRVPPLWKYFLAHDTKFA